MSRDLPSLIKVDPNLLVVGENPKIVIFIDWKDLQSELLEFPSRGLDNGTFIQFKKLYCKNCCCLICWINIKKYLED